MSQFDIIVVSVLSGSAIGGIAGFLFACAVMDKLVKDGEIVVRDRKLLSVNKKL